MVLRVVDRIPEPESNVIMALRDPTRPRLTSKEIRQMFVRCREGKWPGYVEKEMLPDGVAEARSSHNILINLGRQFFRNLGVSNAFPAVAADDDLGSSFSITVSGGTPKTYRVRFIAFGIGGAEQKWTPPGPGTQIEDATVTGLENPYLVAGPNDWMKQVFPISNTADPDLLPDEYTVRHRVILSESEVSYPGSHDSLDVRYDTLVPISEALLLTSAADPFAPPVGGGVVAPAGAIAYNIFPSVPKSLNFVLEAAWELRH